MARERPLQHSQMRELIAQSAARLIAEDGIQDYAIAKRKAARQMGAPDTHSLPSNNEVQAALKAYQALYQKDEQALRLERLRRDALDTMHLLERFNPYLTGSVLSGTATRYSGIDLQLYTDSVKELELFLLNRNIPYETSTRRFRRNDELIQVPCFILHGTDTDIRVAVFSSDDVRKVVKDPADGKHLERARIEQVKDLLAIT